METKLSKDTLPFHKLAVTRACALNCHALLLPKHFWSKINPLFSLPLLSPITAKNNEKVNKNRAPCPLLFPASMNGLIAIKWSHCSTCQQ